MAASASATICFSRAAKMTKQAKGGLIVGAHNLAVREGGRKWSSGAAVQFPIWNEENVAHYMTDC